MALTAASLAYPGGSWTELDGRGFSLLRNFWCDLLRSRAINGADNSWSKALSSVGFAALAVALWPFWLVAAAPFAPRLRRTVVVLGWTSAALLIASSVLPSDRHPILHGAVALTGGLLGAVAGASCSYARLPDEPRHSARRVLGACAVVLALANAALYAHVAYGGGAETVAQPLVQKLATLALLAWMAAVLASGARGVVRGSHL